MKGVARPGLWGFFLGCGAWKWGKKMLSDSLGLARHPELVPAVMRGGDTGRLGMRFLEHRWCTWEHSASKRRSSPAD